MDMATPKAKRERYVGKQAFKDAQELQDFYRKGGTLPYDYVVVGNILYTLHEYDMNGRMVTFANKKHYRMLEVTTYNRYGDTQYTDAIVEEYEAGYLRDDIAYAE